MSKRMEEVKENFESPPTVQRGAKLTTPLPFRESLQEVGGGRRMPRCAAENRPTSPHTIVRLLVREKEVIGGRRMPAE
jgi:hypothetical protein